MTHNPRFLGLFPVYPPHSHPSNQNPIKTFVASCPVRNIPGTRMLGVTGTDQRRIQS